MYRYGVQCALEALPERVPAVFRGTINEVAAASAKAGYDAMELYIHDPKEKDVNEMLRAAKDNGLAYCCICTGLEIIINKLCLTDDSISVRQRAVDRLKEHLDLGAALGCPVVVGSMRGNIPDAQHRAAYLARLGEGLGQLNDYAEMVGGALLIENIHQYTSNYLNTLAEVCAFIEALRLSRLKLHIDTHSMHIEETAPFEAVRQSGDLIGYVHFSDSNRGYPGAGCIDFKAYYHALLDAGYTGYITSECQPYPSQEACAVRGLAYMKAMEQAALLERMPFKED
ncbi:MAG: sugar phosphate isomerase/epimerase [Eubacteriales bacterium]|nr:sugar phosphate isomerase/epimerase [Eubacteriales bacterium]